MGEHKVMAHWRSLAPETKLRGFEVEPLGNELGENPRLCLVVVDDFVPECLQLLKQIAADRGESEWKAVPGGHSFFDCWKGAPLYEPMTSLHLFLIACEGMGQALSLSRTVFCEGYTDDCCHYIEQLSHRYGSELLLLVDVKLGTTEAGFDIARYARELPAFQGSERLALYSRLEHRFPQDLQSLRLVTKALGGPPKDFEAALQGFDSPHGFPEWIRRFVVPRPSLQEISKDPDVRKWFAIPPPPPHPKSPTMRMITFHTVICQMTRGLPTSDGDSRMFRQT